jgi:hypothetical protein
LLYAKHTKPNSNTFFSFGTVRRAHFRRVLSSVPLPTRYSSQARDRVSRPNPPSLSPARPAVSGGGEVPAAVDVGLVVCFV